MRRNLPLIAALLTAFWAVFSWAESLSITDDDGCIDDQDIIQNVMTFNPDAELQADHRSIPAEIGDFKKKIDRVLVFERKESPVLWIWYLSGGCAVADRFTFRSVYQARFLPGEPI
jgi:hypothetical protein